MEATLRRQKRSVGSLLRRDATRRFAMVRWFALRLDVLRIRSGYAPALILVAVERRPDLVVSHAEDRAA